MSRSKKPSKDSKKGPKKGQKKCPVDKKHPKKDERRRGPSLKQKQQIKDLLEQ
jgi:hypothetical protein